MLRQAILALLGASLCLGATQIALLPPWEGFDEPGHFSSIQQLWDEGTVPRAPSARLSTLFAAYRASAPIPYSSVAPFDRNGGWTYSDFFQAEPATVARADVVVHGTPSSPRRFEPSTEENPAAQHPPLFYSLLGPAYGITRHQSLGQQLFVLRMAAYLMAWLGLVAGVVVAARYLPTARPDVATIVAALWPLLLPSWFPAMARLGNDALAALLVGLLWWWIAAYGIRPRWSPLVIGLMLGAGALTKALFLPVAAGTWCWWLIESLLVGAEEGRRLRRGLLVCVFVTSILAAWWYLPASTISVASAEAAELARQGGLASALAQHFSWTGWAEGYGTFFGMLAWSSTWSLTRPPHVLFAPLMLGLLFAVWSFARAIRDRSLASNLSRLLLWWTLPMLAAFSYHMLVHVGLTGSGRGVGGYYLHVLAAPLAGAMGLGVAKMWTSRPVRLVFTGWLSYAVLFAAFASAAQTWLFAGLLTKGPDKIFRLEGPLPDWLGFPEVIDRLSVLAFPHLAIILFVAGAITGLVGLARAYRLVWPRTTESAVRGLAVMAP